jgi:hypothetical protein
MAMNDALGCLTHRPDIEGELKTKWLIVVWCGVVWCGVLLVLGVVSPS